MGQPLQKLRRYLKYDKTANDNDKNNKIFSQHGVQLEYTAPPFLKLLLSISYGTEKLLKYLILLNVHKTNNFFNLCVSSNF